MHLKKKGYFFMLDATLALFVLVIGVFLVLSLYVEVPDSAQVDFLSKDIMNFFSDTKIKDLDNNYAGIGGQLWKNGTITDPENTLLQQIGELYANSQLETAEKFVQNVSDIVPKQYRYEVWIDNTRVYPKDAAQDHAKSRSDTELLLTSKKLIFGLNNRTTNSIWGPYKAEVFAWEK